MHVAEAAGALRQLTHGLGATQPLGQAGRARAVWAAVQRDQVQAHPLETLSLDSTIIPLPPGWQGGAQAKGGGRRLDEQAPRAQCRRAHAPESGALARPGGRRPLGPPAAGPRRPGAGDAGLVMDRAYDGDAPRALARPRDYVPVVPPHPHRARPWSYDRTRYRRRNEVERFFRRLKRFRRLAPSPATTIWTPSSSPSSPSPAATMLCKQCEQALVHPHYSFRLPCARSRSPLPAVRRRALARAGRRRTRLRDRAVRREEEFATLPRKRIMLPHPLERPAASAAGLRAARRRD